MKTSKIKTVHSAKEYSGKNGVTIYHNLTMENGDEINIGKKKTCVVGDELTYELTGDDDGQQRFKKAKSVQPENNFKGGYSGNFIERDGKKYQLPQLPEVQRMIVWQSCFSSICTANQQTAGASDVAYLIKMTNEAFNEAMKHSTLKKDA